MQDVPGGAEGSMKPAVKFDTKRLEDRAIPCQHVLYMCLHGENLLSQFHEALCSATVIEEAENAGSPRPVNLKIVPSRHPGGRVSLWIIRSTRWAQIDPVTETILLGLSRPRRIKAPIMWLVLLSYLVMVDLLTKSVANTS